MTEQDIAGVAVKVSLINVGLSAVMAFVLFKIITRRKPTSYGRLWIGWFAGIATLANFPRVLLHQFDLNAVGTWLFPILFLSPVIWLLGWAYGPTLGRGSYNNGSLQDQSPGHALCCHHSVGTGPCACPSHRHPRTRATTGGCPYDVG